MFSSLIGFLIVITIIVLIHEMGHYLAAKVCGVRVLEFSIGFGKSIFQFYDKHNTKWKIGFIPLGGYVKMYGDAGLASNADNVLLHAISDVDKSKTFAFQSPLRRMFIAFAGPLSNYLLSFVIFVGFLLVYGKVSINNTIGEIIENTPAYHSGIKSGDKIISIDGSSTPSFDKIYAYVSLRPNQIMELEIERNEIIQKLEIKSSQREIKDSNGKVIGIVGILGISPSDPKHIELNIFDAMYHSVDDIITISKMTFTSLGQILFGTRPLDDLRGIVTIADQSGSSLSSGVQDFLIFIAMISINIGFVNLLPIPLLDGGHIILCLYEIITGRAPNDRVIGLLNSFGIVFIIFMFVISTSNDIKALILR